jgi:predicted secreted protein
MDTRHILLIIAAAATSAHAQLYKEPVTTREDALFTIKFKNDAPTTGYSWYWANEKELRDSVQLIKTEVQNNPSFSGGPGRQIFTMRAMKKGRISLKFTKRQPWQDKEVDHKIIKVYIKKRDF